jgi:hypothetical protein
MSYRIPFHRDPGFIPQTIPDNATSDRPVSFELSMAAGPDQARLKSILFATIGMANPTAASWSAQIQHAVVEAFRMSPELFINTVGRVANLTAPAALCRRVGIEVSDKAGDEDDVPITNGALFAKVAPFMTDLALEVALEIQRLTVKGAIDPRFTKPSSGSPGKSSKRSGSARTAPRPSDGSGTAGA